MHHLARLRVDVGPDLEEEGDVPDVVEAERQQHALDEPVDRHRRRRVAVGGPVAEVADRPPDRRPDDGQDGGQGDRRERHDDGDEALPGEEAEVRGERDPVVAVEERRGDQADQDAAEDPGVDRLHAEDLLDLGAAPGRGEGGLAPVRRRVEGGGAFPLALEPERHRALSPRRVPVDHLPVLRLVDADGAEGAAHPVEEDESRSPRVELDVGGRRPGAEPEGPGRRLEGDRQEAEDPQRGDQDEVADRGRHGGGAVVAGEAQDHADREDQRQDREDRVAGRPHHLADLDHPGGEAVSRRDRGADA